MNDNNYNNMPKGGRLVFGIFMVLVYVGVGLLFIFDVFQIDNVAISATCGGLLALTVFGEDIVFTKE